MNIRYTASYYDIDDNLIKVDILKNDYFGDSEEVLLSSDPIEITYESDDIFKPIKYSGCSIKICTPKILTELYTGKVTDSQIRIYRNNNLFWEGYISPNIYNSEWLTDYDEITIEGIDTLSALQYKDFTYSPSGKDKPTSFEKLILDILNSYLDTAIESVIFQSTLDNNNRQLLSVLSVLERNWYNEDGENKTKLNEVLEDIMQFLGLSLYQYENKYYMVDITSLGREDLIVSDINLKTGISRERKLITNHKQYEVRENNSDVALGDVYNKVNVVCSLIDIENNLINMNSETLEDDADILANYNEISLYNKTDKTANLIFFERIVPKNVENNDWFFQYTDTAYLSQPQTKGFGTFMREAPIAAKWVGVENNDVYPKYFKQSALDWRSYFTYKLGTIHTSEYFLINWETLVNNLINDTTAEEVLNIYSDDIACYPKGGYFILHKNFEFGKWLGKLGGLGKGNYEKDTTYLNQYRVAQYKPKLVKQDGQYFVKFAFLAKLKIGNKYWNGTEWTTTESKFYYQSEGRYAYNGHIDNMDGEYNIENTNNFTVRTEDNDSGWLIPITSNLMGKIEFTLYDSIVTPNTTFDAQYLKEPWDIISDFGVEALQYCYVNSLSLSYTPQSRSDQFAIYKKENKENDLVYSQVIDDNNISELSDIELNLNTYNQEIHNQLSYSYVFKNNEYMQQIEKNGAVLRPEQHLVKMYSDYYSKPKIKHQNTIEFDIKPTDLIYVNSLRKYLLLGGNISYNLYNNNATVELIEM